MQKGMCNMQIATKGATKFFSEIYRYFGKEGGEIRIKNPKNPNNWMVLEFVLLGNAKDVSAASIGIYETGLEEDEEMVGSNFIILFEEDYKGDATNIQILGYEENTQTEAVYINENNKAKCYDYIRNIERFQVYDSGLKKHFFEYMCFIIEDAGFLKKPESVKTRNKDMTFYFECDTADELHEEIVGFYGH